MNCFLIWSESLSGSLASSNKIFNENVPLINNEKRTHFCANPIMCDKPVWGGLEMEQQTLCKKALESRSSLSGRCNEREEDSDWMRFRIKPTNQSVSSVLLFAAPRSVVAGSVLNVALQRRSSGVCKTTSNMLTAKRANGCVQKKDGNPAMFPASKQDNLWNVL